MNKNVIIYILMFLAGMFLMYQCQDTIKTDDMTEYNYVSKEKYDSLNTLYSDMQSKAKDKEVIIALLERKNDSLTKLKSNVKGKYTNAKNTGRIIIIENPCNTDSILKAYDNLSAHCDSMNLVNDTIISVLNNKNKACMDMVAYKDTMLNAQKRVIEFKDKDFKVSEDNNKALKKENRKLKIKNIIVTSVALLATTLTIYSIIKK